MNPMNVVTLYAADVRELRGREQAALAFLPPARREKTERVRPEEDKLRSMAAGLLLRRVLNVREDGDLRCGEFGKPELTGEGPHFNLSHGGNYVILAVGGTPLGVDVEPLSERVPTVSPRFFHPGEWEWLGDDLAPDHFFHLWTRLESVLKADGRGLLWEEREFSVMDDSCPWYIETLIHDSHIISCAAGERFSLEMQILHAEQLID